LRTGEIQLVGGAGALGPSRVDEALQIEGITLLEHATQAWNHIDLKQWDHLRMTKVRQALDFATPSKDIVEKLLKGRALPSVADQAPGSWAFDADIQPRPYDLEQAKALLAEAGLTPGPDGVLQGPVPTDDPNVGDGEVKPLDIELWFVSGSTDSERVCQVVGQSWNSIGVKTTVKNQDVSTIWGPEGYQFSERMTGALFSWYNGNDPTDTFYWHSSQIPDSPTGTGGNLPAYFHKYSFQDEIDKLTTQGDSTTDQEERKKIYAQIQELLHEEVPVIFIYWQKAYPALAKNIGGFWPSAFNYLLWNANEWYLT
jgi:peptide/nickel transport system substrate-binding protein